MLNMAAPSAKSYQQRVKRCRSDAENKDGICCQPAVCLGLAFSLEPCEMITVIIPILQIGELRLIEVI